MRTPALGAAEIRALPPLVLLWALCVAALPASAQIPDEFTNLKLLAADIDKPQLVAVMRDWALGLGVRCSHCHVGPDNLQGMDFASDEKAAKRTARRMLEMSRAINGQFLAELPIREEGEAAQTVSCYACHRGLAKPPRQLVVTLGEEARESGPGAALEKYRTLRNEHENAGRYDFREETLIRLARGFVETGDFEPALEILDGAMEIFPDSPSLHASKGMVELGREDFEAARASFEAALSLDPDFESARRGLAHLESMLQPAIPEGGD